jgi:hypothetical protein
LFSDSFFGIWAITWSPAAKRIWQNHIQCESTQYSITIYILRQGLIHQHFNWYTDVSFLPPLSVSTFPYQSIKCISSVLSCSLQREEPCVESVSAKGEQILNLTWVTYSHAIHCPHQVTIHLLNELRCTKFLSFYSAVQEKGIRNCLNNAMEGQLPPSFHCLMLHSPV